MSEALICDNCGKAEASAMQRTHWFELDVPGLANYVTVGRKPYPRHYCSRDCLVAGEGPPKLKGGVVVGSTKVNVTLGKDGPETVTPAEFAKNVVDELIRPSHCRMPDHRNFTQRTADAIRDEAERQMTKPPPRPTRRDPGIPEKREVPKRRWFRWFGRAA